MRAPATSFMTPAAVSAVAALALALAAGPAAARSADDSTQIYRCDMPGGKVIFSDSRCSGAARVTQWRPRRIEPGLHLTNQGTPAVGPSEIPATAVEVQPGPTLTADLEPYTDCRARGGDYRVGARLCILPSALDER